MEVLAAMVFEACVALTLPNPLTVNNLPDEQRELIIEYTDRKCKAEAEAYLGTFQPPVRECRESKLGECM